MTKTIFSKIGNGSSVNGRYGEKAYRNRSGFTTTKHIFVRFDFTGGEVLRLVEELEKSEKQASSSESIFTIVALLSTFISLRASRQQVDVNTICHDYDAFRKSLVSPVHGTNVGLDTLFEEDPFSAYDEDTVEEPLESLSKTRSRIGEIGCATSVSEKGYGELVQ